MGCRCLSISYCSNDINVAVSIKERLLSLQKASESTDMVCNQISIVADNALMPPSTDMSMKIKKLNDPIIFTNLISACESHINQLNFELTSMQNEDYYYHNPPRESNYGV